MAEQSRDTVRFPDSSFPRRREPRTQGPEVPARSKIACLNGSNFRNRCKCCEFRQKDNCKVQVAPTLPLILSLSNHRQRSLASFDRLTMSGLRGTLQSSCSARTSPGSATHTLRSTPRQSRNNQGLRPRAMPTGNCAFGKMRRELA